MVVMWYFVAVFALACLSWVGMKLGEHGMDSYESRRRRSEHDHRMKLRISLNTLDYWFREHVKDYTRFGPPTLEELKRWQAYIGDAIEADQRADGLKSRDYTSGTKHGTIGIRLITETEAGHRVVEQFNRRIEDEVVYCLGRLRYIFAEAEIEPEVPKKESKGAAK